MNGPSMSSNNGYQYLWMDPLLLLKMAANVHEWAQCSYQELLPMDSEGAHYRFWKMLPMSTIVLSVSTKNCCRWTWNGPLITSEKCCRCPRSCLVFLQRNAANTLAWAHYYSLKNAANGHEWAQCFYQEMLPIWLHWPIITAEKYCQWPWMGPVLLPRNAADSLAWDHHCCL